LKTQGAALGIVPKFVKVKIAIKQFESRKKTRHSQWHLFKIHKRFEIHPPLSNPWKHKAQPHGILPKLVKAKNFNQIHQILKMTRRSQWNLTNICKSLDVVYENRSNPWKYETQPMKFSAKCVKVKSFINMYQILKKTKRSQWFFTKIRKKLYVYQHRPNPWTPKGQPRNLTKVCQSHILFSEFIKSFKRAQPMQFYQHE